MKHKILVVLSLALLTISIPLALAESRAYEALAASESAAPSESNTGGAMAAAVISGTIAAGAIGYFATRKPNDLDEDSHE